MQGMTENLNFQNFNLVDIFCNGRNPINLIIIVLLRVKRSMRKFTLQLNLISILSFLEQ